MFQWLKSVFAPQPLSEEEYQQERDKVLAAAPIPLFWLFGKTGSGKTSIVRYLTGAEAAEIGNGFQPKTATSRTYDFPAAEQPVLRFLDTRGVAEGTYDPREDVRQFHESAHVMIVTVRLADSALESVIGPLREFRKSQPQRPVLLALTCLHDLYPGRQHPDPDPFVERNDDDRILPDVRRAIAHHQSRFAGLVDRVVPIDLTRPEDGFLEAEFGGARLKQTLLELLPAAFRQTFLNLTRSLDAPQDLTGRRAMPYVVAYSTLAATAAAVPTPWVDIPVVVAIQSHLVYVLHRLYGLDIDGAVLRRLAAAGSARMVTALIVREALKFIPVVGVAANAASAYAYTYGLGVACCWYFDQVRAGRAPTEDEIRKVWKEQLSIAARSWKLGRSSSFVSGPESGTSAETTLKKDEQPLTDNPRQSPDGESLSPEAHPLPPEAHPQSPEAHPQPPEAHR